MSKGQSSVKDIAFSHEFHIRYSEENFVPDLVSHTDTTHPELMSIKGKSDPPQRFIQKKSCGDLQELCRRRKTVFVLNVFIFI